MTPDLEPSGLGHDLLTSWAPWVREDKDPSLRWTCGPRVVRGYHGDWPLEVQITDKILAPLRRDKSVYWTMAAHWYIGEKTFTQITRDLGPQWPEKRIRLNLVCLCELVSREYLDSREFFRARIRAGECHPRSPVRNVLIPA